MNCPGCGMLKTRDECPVCRLSEVVRIQSELLYHLAALVTATKPTGGEN